MRLYRMRDLTWKVLEDRPSKLILIICTRNLRKYVTATRPKHTVAAVTFSWRTGYTVRDSQKQGESLKFQMLQQQRGLYK